MAMLLNKYQGRSPSYGVTLIFNEALQLNVTHETHFVFVTLKHKPCIPFSFQYLKIGLQTDDKSSEHV
jgi:hypothetical protein